MSQRGNRREVLADAATEVLAAEGARGLTHRAVDRQAWVPLGTTKNYFPTRDALFMAVASRMADQHAAAVQQLREQTPDGVTSGDVAALYAAMLQRAGSGGRTQFLALFELHLEAVRRPELRATLGEMVLANADSATDLHAAAGCRVDRRGAGLLDASLMGIAMSLLSLPEETLRALGLDETDSLGPALQGLARSASNQDGAGIGALADAVRGCAS